MRTLTTALLVGIGAARLTQTIKEALPVIPPSAYKSTFASIAAGATGAVLIDGDWRARTVVGAGAAGFAMLAHEVASLLSLLSDRQKVHVLRATARG